MSITEQQIVELYLSNKTINFIHTQYKVPIKQIQKTLILSGVEIKVDKRKIKQVNKNFFEEIDSEEKSYLLGFLYADGSISGFNLCIKLGIEDLQFLEKIKAILESEHKIGIYRSNSGYNIGKEFCQLSINNPKIINDLLKLGCVYNKTDKLVFPSCNQVSSDLVPHFIRGYFDGDGSVFQNGTNLNISILGTKDFLEPILNIFQEKCGTKSKLYPTKSKNTFAIQLGGNSMIKHIFDYLYKDATIFLERKKNRFDNYFI